MSISDVKINDILPSELYHFGIKGQKWGVRHEQDKASMAKAAAKNTGKVIGGTAAGAAAGWLGVLGAAAGSNLVLKAKTSAIMQKVDSGTFKGNIIDTLAKTKNSHDKVWNFFEKHGLKIIGGAALIGAATAAGVVTAKHIKKKKQESANSAKHSDNYSDELYHFNIKGAKWGIRRYQNYDGTLTEAGKARYGVNSLSEAKPDSKATKLYNKDLENSYNAQKNIAQETKNISESIAGRLNPKRGSKRVNTANYSKMSDDDLRKRINRLALEKQYGDLTGDNKYKMTGREVTREILQTAGVVAGIGASAAAIMLSIRQMRLGG